MNGQLTAVTVAGASALLMELLSKAITKMRIVRYIEWRKVCSMGITHLLQPHVDVEVLDGNLSPVGKILLKKHVQ